MTDHYLNAELCAGCPDKVACLAITPDGTWNPYLKEENGKPCPAVLQNQKVI